MNLDADNMSPLAKADGVALLTRKPISEIYAMAEGGDIVSGKYVWVWNVATNPAGDKRDLRWWIGEVLIANEANRKQKAEMTLEQVIDLILPRSRREFPAGEVCRLLQVRPITLRDLRFELNGALRSNSGFYPRAGLVKFFQSRWLGAEPRLGNLQTATGGKADSAKTIQPTNHRLASNGQGRAVSAAGSAPLNGRASISTTKEAIA